MSITFTSKSALVSSLKSQISSRKEVCIKALLTIYEYQTDDEKAIGETTVLNGKGFTGRDAEFLTSLVDKYTTYGRFTDRQMEALFKAMPKYAGQLIDSAIEKGIWAKIDGVYIHCPSSNTPKESHKEEIIQYCKENGFEEQTMSDFLRPFGIGWKEEVRPDERVFLYFDLGYRTWITEYFIGDSSVRECIIEIKGDIKDFYLHSEYKFEVPYTRWEEAESIEDFLDLQAKDLSERKCYYDMEGNLVYKK